MNVLFLVMLAHKAVSS